MKKKKEISFEELPEFKRDFKKLLKKFPTLNEDFKTFKNTALKAFHLLGIENVGIFAISGLGIVEPKIYKAKKFACRSLQGTGSNSGIRVIYAFFEKDKKIEFIEIYFKGNKENENRKRILKNYG